jgi:hypothetical protein
MSIIDFGALSQLTNFYMERVEEKLAWKGLKKNWPL